MRIEPIFPWPVAILPCRKLCISNALVAIMRAGAISNITLYIALHPPPQHRWLLRFTIHTSQYRERRDWTGHSLWAPDNASRRLSHTEPYPHRDFKVKIYPFLNHSFKLLGILICFTSFLAEPRPSDRGSVSPSRRRLGDTRYKHSSLNLQRNEIRLLRLLPGKNDDGIECELFKESLNELRSYSALSYTWGTWLFPYDHAGNASATVWMTI